MMARAGRMAIVEAKRQPPMRAPIELENRQPFALHCIEHREIPRQNVTANAAAPRDDGVEKIAKRFGKSIAGASRHELHPAVDVPADDKKRASRTCQRIAYRG